MYKKKLLENIDKIHTQKLVLIELKEIWKLTMMLLNIVF